MTVAFTESVVGNAAFALLEALGYAVVHGPAKLASWTLARLLGKHPSKPFNPLIANAFFRAGYIESWRGRDIEKINRECREPGIDPPAYDFGMAGLMLTFRANPAHARAAASGTTQQTTQDRLGEKLGETRAAIVQSMKDNPRVTVSELAKRLHLSTSAIEKNIH